MWSTEYLTNRLKASVRGIHKDFMDFEHYVSNAVLGRACFACGWYPLDTSRCKVQCPRCGFTFDCSET